MRTRFAQALRVGAILWATGLALFWVVGLVKSVFDQGIGLLNPFDLSNILSLVAAFIVFSIEMIPAFVLLWLADRIDVPHTAGQ